MIHFWVPSTTASPADVLAWDPDREPGRYASGVGHNLLELGVRLQRGGLDVSLGEEVPRGARLLVVFPKSVYQRGRLQAVLRAGQRAGGRFAVVRSDTPLSWGFPVRPVVEFMPTRGAVRHRWQQWLPPLPQRGLEPRLEDRFGRIRSVAFKGYPENVPSVLGTPEWAEALASRGVEWLLDAAADADGAGQRWHDFAAVDAVLCVRAERTTENIERKPATRLINAWAAGCVPLAEPDPGYVELGTDGSDVFFIDSPFGALSVIDRLNADGDLLARVERRIRERAATFAAASILDQWREALVEAASPAGASRRRFQATRTIRARATLASGAFLDPALAPARRAIAITRRRAALWRKALRVNAFSGRTRT